MADAVPALLLDGILRRLAPAEVWLFGSRARGDARPDSDFDLLVVMDDDAGDDRYSSRAKAEARADYPGPADIVLTRRSSFDRRRRVVGTLEELVAAEGVPVYVRG
jgi:predicted nucleotidyltransferase